MASKITFFPVDCGDMTLISLGEKQERKILIDCNIRAAADDPEDDTRDVAADLRKALKKDSKGRPYVDAFLLSHPDQDHCRGLKKHFYLGKTEDYPDDEVPQCEKRIIIREIWSSPIVFRRASKDHVLCDDASAFNKEAKRRVKVNRDANFSGVQDGDRILVLGEDEDGKTDDLGPILVKVDTTFSKVNGTESKVFSAMLLAPLAASEIDAEEDELGKNHSSIILNVDLAANEDKKTTKKFLTGGDAEVVIWEGLWDKHKKSKSVLEYDFLLSPHHCSWHSLSHDSWSDLGEDVKVSKSARSALSQIRSKGKIVASSAPIKDDENDPPCIRAKREYEDVVKGAGGKFHCTGEEPSEKSPAPLEFLIEDSEESGSKKAGPAILSAGLIDRIAAQAAEREPVRKDGNRRYA